MEYLITTLLSVVGGASGFLLTNYIKLRSENRQDKVVDSDITLKGDSFLANEYNRILERYKNDIKTYKEDVESLEKKYNEIEKEMKHKDEEILKLNMQVSSLTSEMQIFRNSNNDMPFASWIKDNIGRYILINDAFNKQFVEPAKRTDKWLMGRTDAEWKPTAVAENLHRLNEIARTSEKGVVMAQDIRLDNTQELYFVFKYRIYIGKTPIGVCGVAIPKRLLTEKGDANSYRIDCENCGKHAMNVRVDDKDLYKCTDCGWEKPIDKSALVVK